MWRASTRGDTHNCLGIASKFIEQKVKMDVVEQTLDVLKEFLMKFEEANRNSASKSGLI